MSNGSFNMEKLGLGEHEPINPLVPIIENLFSHEFHESSWHKYTLDQAIELFKSKAKEKEIKATERHYQSFKRKMKRCKTTVDFLMLLNETLFGEAKPLAE
jgi:hypothetical protein